MAIVNATEKDFKELTNDGLVLVDFHATWCGPCKMIAPVLEEIANDRSDVKIIKVDIDKDRMLAREFGVMSVPTLFMFKDGKVVSQKGGYMPKEMLINFIEDAR